MFSLVLKNGIVFPWAKATSFIPMDVAFNDVLMVSVVINCFYSNIQILILACMKDTDTLSAYILKIDRRGD